MKKSALLILLTLLILPVTGVASLPGRYQVQIPYSPPAAKSLDQVTVQIVFAFDCGHCYNYHRKEAVALKRKFNDKIHLVNLPIGWRGKDPGRLYFIAEEKGKGDAVISMIFDFVFNKGLGKEMFNRDKLQFVARLNNLQKEFDTLMDHPRIVKKMDDSIRFSDDRKITGTPTVVIEGVLFPERDFNNMVTIINALLKEPVN